MGRFEPKYSPEQRRAVVSAVLDGGVKVTQAVSEARQGLDGLAPFTMPANTAYGLVRNARDRRARERYQRLLDESPAAALEDFQRRILRLPDGEAARIAREARATGHLDVQAIAHVGRCPRSVKRGLPPQPPEPRATPATEPERGPTEFVQRLQAAPADLESLNGG